MGTRCTPPARSRGAHEAPRARPPAAVTARSPSVTASTDPPVSRVVAPDQSGLSETWNRARQIRGHGGAELAPRATVSSTSTPERQPWRRGACSPSLDGSDLFSPCGCDGELVFPSCGDIEIVPCAMDVCAAAWSSTTGPRTPWRRWRAAGAPSEPCAALSRRTQTSPRRGATQRLPSPTPPLLIRSWLLKSMENWRRSMVEIVLCLVTACYYGKKVDRFSTY